MKLEIDPHVDKTKSFSVTHSTFLVEYVSLLSSKIVEITSKSNPQQIQQLLNSFR